MPYRLQPRRPEQVSELFACLVITIFVFFHVTKSMRVACPCCDTERLWPFQFVNLFAFAGFCFLLFDTWQHVVEWWQKRKEQKEGPGVRR